MARFDFVQAEEFVDEGVGVGHHVSIVSSHVRTQPATLIVRDGFDHILAIVRMKEKFSTLGVRHEL